MNIRYTRPALADLDDILDYIAERSPQGAHLVRVRMRQVMTLIASYPSSGRLTDEASIRRQIVPSTPYVVFYEVGDNEVIIHAVRHGARNPGTMPGGGSE